MKRNTLLALLLIISQPASFSQNSQNTSRFSGSWLGTLETGAFKIRLVFNIVYHRPDSLSATMDSPDQGAKGLPAGKVTVENDSLKIFAPFIAGKYIGRMTSDSTVSGFWIQAGNKLACNLKKQAGMFKVKRPQEPTPPYPYTVKEVTIENKTAGITLSGTLTVPPGEGPFPAVVLITGSGAQDRNESLLGHKPFLVIADRLARKGIASLRYDDRGVGKSKGSYATATSADLATDALAAFYFLRDVGEIKKDAIGFAGHSEGGLIAPIAASEEKEVAFIISLAGPGVNGEKIVLTQSADISRVMGIDEKTIKSNIELSKRFYSILRKEPDNKKAEELILSELKKSLIKSKTSPEDIEKAVSNTKATFGASLYPWFRYFIVTEPSAYWKQVKCPVLAINGEKDLQVSSAINLPAIEKAVKKGGNINVKTIEMPGLNHLFQSCTTGAPSEYGTIEETFSDEVLNIMAEWINGLAVLH
jgi:fermentation-respiration switch protein FrsA (DUF1100 family)